jgi:type III secretory pathway component EscU
MCGKIELLQALFGITVLLMGVYFIILNTLELLFKIDLRGRNCINYIVSSLLLGGYLLLGTVIVFL